MIPLIAALLAAAPPADPPAPPPSARELQVCADPNNMPFSDKAGEGFENKLAELVARDLGAKLSYVWWAQRRGNVRETLNSGLCDLIPGVGSSLEMLATTAPYYRSSYVVVTRSDRQLDVQTFDDPRLRTLKIGVQLVGDDGSNTPPAHALMRRGIIENVHGYMIYGDYSEADPQAGILKAVANGDVDLAFVWGPVAAYFAGRQAAPLSIRPLSVRFDGPQLPMLFDVSMGVRKNDPQLLKQVDEILQRRSAEVKRIVAAYRVPLSE
jgi:mxaJ protein